MKTICTHTQITVLPKKIRRFAFTQDDNGKVDLTLNKSYEIYGIRRNRYGTFYLVLTDSIHHNLPWWLPDTFFEKPDSPAPSSWVTKTFGRIRKETYITSPFYFDAIEDIEDGTPKGREAFEKMKHAQ